MEALTINPLWTIVPTTVIAAAAVVYTGFTIWLVLETSLLRSAQTKPFVILYPKPDDRRPSVIVLVIENVGTGVAYDVAFHSTRRIPVGAWGIASLPANSKEEDLYPSHGPLVEGIPALGPK